MTVSVINVKVGKNNSREIIRLYEMKCDKWSGRKSTGGGYEKND